MEDPYQIKITIRGKDSRAILGVLVDFFGGPESLASPLFANFEPYWKPGHLEYRRPKVIPSSSPIYISCWLETPGCEPLNLARIFIRDNSPSYAILRFEGNEDGADWDAVGDFARQVIKKMEVLGFEIMSVAPQDLMTTGSEAPWEKIGNDERARAILKMWWEHASSPEIAREVHLDAGTVTNIISKLRTKWGPDIVITDMERKKRLRGKRN